MSALVSHMFSSGGAALVLVVGALWIWRRPGSSWARRWLIAGALAYAGLSCFALSYATGRLLCAGFRPLTSSEIPSGATAIVVLGSGSYTARDWDNTRYPVLDRASATRVLEALRVFKMTDAAWMIASGGLPRPTEFDEPNGRTMRDALVRSGIPAVASAPRNRVQKYP